MVNVNELRIGNWVQRPEELRSSIIDGNQIYFFVGPVMIRDCQHYKDNWAFEPVPLSAEILENAGFGYLDFRNRKIYILEDFEISLYPNGEFTFMWNGQVVYIKSVHQLQNLYFALTNEELSITL